MNHWLYRSARKVMASHEKNRGISLVNIASKLLPGLILACLPNTHKRQMWKDQPGFRRCRICIHPITNLRTQAVVVEDWFSWFEIGVRSSRLCGSLTLPVKRMCQKNLFLSSGLCIRVRGYDNLSLKFTKRSVSCQCSLFSHFLFNGIIEMVNEKVLSSCDSDGTDICPNRNPSDRIWRRPCANEPCPDRLHDDAGIPGTRFVPTKCNMLQYWSG